MKKIGSNQLIMKVDGTRISYRGNFIVKIHLFHLYLNSFFLLYVDVITGDIFEASFGEF
jgi:hypothetical protein